MTSRGPDDRDQPTGRDATPPTDANDPPTVAEEVGETADPDAEPPVHPNDPKPSAPSSAMGTNWPDERSPAPSSDAWDRPAAPWSQGEYPPGYGRPAEPQAWETQPPGEAAASPSAPAARRDRFGWTIPEGMDADGNDGQSAAHDHPSPPGQWQGAPPSAPRDDTAGSPQPYNPYDTSAWRVPSAPDTPPRGPYSGQIPTQQPGPDAPPRGGYSGQMPAQQPPRQSGPFPVAPSDDARRSGAFPMSPDPARSGTFPTVPEAVYQSGTYAASPDPNTYDPARSVPIPQNPYISGAMPQVQRSGQIAYPSEVTATGSRRVIVAPDAGFGSLLSDRPALAFLLAAVALAGAMIAFIALRYSHFPDQIALHFGPAGASEPTRIGEKRELWTIPFIVGIVLAADTALAWAVYRFDRFAARLLTLGSGLVAAIAWVVLLTVLHR